MSSGDGGGQLQLLREAIEGLDLAPDADAIAEARELLDRFSATIAAAEAEYATTGQVEVDGYPNMAAFLRHRCDLTLTGSRSVAKRAARLGAWPELGDAWIDGRVTGAQVDLACAKVPDRQVERFAETLEETIAIVGHLTAHETGVVLRQWVSHADDAAQREAAEAGIEPQTTIPERELSASRSLDDELVINGHLDTDSAAQIEAALRAATRDDLDGEVRTPAQRRADALVEIARHYLETLDDPGTNRRRERVTLVADTRDVYRSWLTGAGVHTAHQLETFLAARPELGELDRGLFLDAFNHTTFTSRTLDGNPITPALLAAVTSGGVLELLLTADSRPLNLGRSRRTFSDTQRRVLLARWGGCACCGAPPESCEIHHIQPWEEGGLTDLANGVPKCRRCHLLHHRPGWRNRLEPDGTYIVTTPDGDERTYRSSTTTDLPTLPVATSAEPARPLAPYDEWNDRFGPPDPIHHHPDVIDLSGRIIHARVQHGDGHPTTLQLRDELERLIERLERELGLAA